MDKVQSYISYYDGKHAEIWATSRGEAKQKAGKYYNTRDHKLIIVVPKRHILGNLAQLLTG
jgi:hypothetical protein